MRNGRIPISRFDKRTSEIIHPLVIFRVYPSLSMKSLPTQQANWHVSDALLKVQRPRAHLQLVALNN